MGLHYRMPRHNTYSNVAKNIYQSQENARQVINKALTVVVPAKFQQAGGNVGPLVYRTTDDPKAISMSKPVTSRIHLTRCNLAKNYSQKAELRFGLLVCKIFYNDVPYHMIK